MAYVGEVFYAVNFVFKDGGTADKLIVLLGVDQFSYYFAKTTSTTKYRQQTAGCQQQNTKFHSHYIPVGSTNFVDHTWICLDEYYEFRKVGFDEDVRDGKIRRKFKIDPCPVLACALDNPGLDVSQEQIDALTAAQAANCVV